MMNLSTTKPIRAFATPGSCPRQRTVAAQAQKQERSWMQTTASVALAAALVASPVSSALAGSARMQILAEPTPTSSYLIDDAGVINKTTKKAISDQLKRLDFETGFRVQAITVRRLEVETDAFAFADKVLESWYPTPELGDKKGIILIVTSGKDGAVTGGPAFMKTVGDAMIDSIISDNIPIFTGEEKYNECLVSSATRVGTALNGKPDPGPPVRTEDARKRTFKTKDEVERTKGVSSTVVGTLLFISVVVPMLQYYGYTSKE